MGLILKLRDALAEPRLRDIDIDEPERITVHQEILRERPMVQGVFKDFYDTLRRLDEKLLSGDGTRVEMGSGTGLFKEYYPDVVLTDVVPADHLDMVLDAQNMDLPDASVRAFYGIHTFHHFPNVNLLFNELERVLVPGGGCVLIEPYYGPGATQFFTRLFRTEGFDKTQRDWGHLDGSKDTVMSGANQALSYIVFRRDRERFEAAHPTLKVAYQERMHNYLRYILSGGINFRQLAPTFTAPLMRAVEWALSPFDHPWTLHYAIVIRKTAGQGRRAGLR